MTPALEAAYAEPHRRYHTGIHIEDCLTKLAAVPDLSEAERRVMTWAIWWHDAVIEALPRQFLDPRHVAGGQVGAELDGHRP